MKRRLLPGHPAVLICRDAVDIRFLHLYRKAWKMIPLRYRRILLNYWRSDIFLFMLNADCEKIQYPIVELVPTITSKRSVIGCCIHPGHHLKFRKPSIRRMSDLEIIDVILHELAHVACHALGRDGHHLTFTNTNDKDRQLDAEISVEEMIEEWIACYTV